MMTHRTTGYVAGITMALSIAVFIAGCSPDARQDLGEAGAKVGSATEKSAQATEDAAKKTGQDIKVGAENAGEAVKGGIQNAADATKEGARMAGEAVGGIGDKLELTPKIKAALIADKSIDASTLNVDTIAESKMVVIKGIVPSAETKSRVTRVAQKVLDDTSEGKSGYKIKNDVTVGGGTKM